MKNASCADGGPNACPEQKIDHGYEEPLSGGTDVMKQLQNRLLVEQGRPPRDETHRLAALRSATIRLAFERSDLRPHLLPLLKD
jgi:hypothetical protein